MTTNVAQLLINFLQTNGVEYLYGVTGDSVFPLFDSLSKQNEIKFIGATNEVNAAFMASYQARLTGKIGVCVATSGPGIANLVNGLADAYFDRVPVVAITGQVSLNKIGTKSKQYLNQQKLLQEVTCSSEIVTSSDTVLSVISEAFEKATNKKTVTHVSLPEDILKNQINNDISMIDTRTLHINRSGFAGNIEKIISDLKKAKKPLLFVGTNDKELQEVIEKFAETLNAAIIISQQAKGIIADDHSKVIGGMGEAFIPEIIEEVDLIIKIGSASFEKKYFPAGINIIQILNEKETINYKMTGTAIKGNVHQILNEIIKQIKPKENNQWATKITQEKEKLNKMISEQRKNKENPIHPGYLMTVLSDYVPEDAIIVCDIGAFAHWFDTYFQAKKQTILMSSYWRSMGSALAGSLSCALNQTDRKVIALIGDGGFLLSLSEIATAVKYKLAVTVIIANNHLYEIEKQKMEHKNINPFGIDIHVPDYAALATNFGAEGNKVSDSEKLELLMEKSLGIEGPVVIDVLLKQVKLPFIK